MESSNNLHIEGYAHTEPMIRKTKGAAQTTFVFATYVSVGKGKEVRETWKVRAFISPSFTSTIHKGDSIVIEGKVRNRAVATGKYDIYILAEKIFKKATTDQANI